MKSLLKYVLGACLFLSCFSAVLAAGDEIVVYEVPAVLIGAEIGNEFTPPFITVMTEAGEAIVWVIEESLFFQNRRQYAWQPADVLLTFAQFAEQHMGEMVILEFIVYEDEYFVVACTWMPAM